MEQKGKTTWLASCSAADLAKWACVRRYAVPRSMIVGATPARETGDWRAACRASNVDTLVDLAEVAGRYGVAVAERLDDDLRHLAPDLVRWHLPRVSGTGTTLLPHAICVLASYGEQAADGPFLMVRTPSGPLLPQRLQLAFGMLPSVHPQTRREWWTGSRHLWDVRRSDELRERCGGGERAPFFHADGTPLADSQIGSGNDVAARTERVVALHDAGDLAGVFAAAGVDIAPSPQWSELVDLPVAPSRWARELAELRQLDEVWLLPFGRAGALVLVGGGTQRVRGRIVERADLPRMTGRKDWLLRWWSLPETAWRRLPDLDLLRTGRITPDQLHPLVHAALFPRVSKVGDQVGPPEPPSPQPVRVRCRDAWHEVQQRDGALQLLSHDDREEARERAVVALSGPEGTGCFAVKRQWINANKGLPWRLAAQRRDLFLRVRHGDTDGVEQLLDAGCDPGVRDSSGRGLLHHLARLDHERLLPRLLAAGLDVEAPDNHGATPLQCAASNDGSLSLLTALGERDG